MRLGHDSYQYSSHYPRLSPVQYSFTGQHCGLMHHSCIHSLILYFTVVAGPCTHQPMEGRDHQWLQAVRTNHGQYEQESAQQVRRRFLRESEAALARTTKRCYLEGIAPPLSLSPMWIIIIVPCTKTLLAPGPLLENWSLVRIRTKWCGASRHTRVHYVRAALWHALGCRRT